MTTHTRVNELDLLRFMAAMAVVLFHYTFHGPVGNGKSAMPYDWPNAVTQYGSYGVELFFMISGFVILMTAGSGSLRQFVVSRMVRLYPAYWVCCTLTFLAILWMGAPHFSATWWQYLVNLTMLNEFVHVRFIDGVYWTLVVELRFYLLIAIVLAFGKIHRIEPLLALWLLLSVAMEFWPVEAVQRIFITAHSGYFIAGATCYLVWAQGLSVQRMGLITASWMLVVQQTLESLPQNTKGFRFNLDPLVAISVITVFFFVMLLVSLRKTGRFGRRRWILAGALTYPLYLLHQNIGYMIFNKLYPAVNEHVLMASTILLMLVLAYLVHVVFEKRLAPALTAALHRLTGSVKTVRALP